MPKRANAQSSPPCAPGRMTFRSPICSSPPPLTIAISMPGIRSIFINKALESVDLAGWEHAELAFTSVVPNLSDARRMEESNAWRKPIDLIPILQAAFAELPQALETGSEKHATYDVESLMTNPAK